MIDESRARELAEAAAPESVVLGDARELTEGWFFPYITKRGNTSGVIINKTTGQPFRLVLSPPDRAIDLYERGYQFEKYDLVILTIADLDETVRALLQINIVTVDVYYKYERVWRVGRTLTEAEIRDRLSTLPCIFSGRFPRGLEHVERARQAGWFTFKALEYRGRE